MRFLGKLKSRRLSKVLTAFATSGMLIFCGNTLANADEPEIKTNTNIEVETVNDAMNNFKNTYFAAPQNNKIFHHNISAFGMTFLVEVDAQGQIMSDNSVKMGGNINFEYTNPVDNQFTINRMPFYIEQSGADTIFYVQPKSKWNRFTMPDISVWLIDSLKASDFEALNENLKAIKSVEVFRENDAQKIFNITFDGKFLADITQAYEESKNTTAYSAEELISQKSFFDNLIAALENADIICTWIVNNQTNETVSAIFDLTPLMKAYAQNILDESAAGKFELSEDDFIMLDNIINYSQFRVSTTYSDIDTKQKMTPPSGARKVVVSNDIFEEFIDRIIKNSP